MKKVLSLFALVLAAPVAFAHTGGHGADAEKAPQDSYGRAGDVAKVSRTVPLELTATGGCLPARIAVKRGETLRLVAKNAGTAEQDLALGRQSDLEAHAEMVRKFPQMQAAQSHRVTVKPGESRDLVWQFARAGQFNLACGAPARFDAQSAGKVVVTAR